MPARSVSALANAFALMGAQMRYRQNSEIYGEAEPCEYLYEVVSGAVRTSKLLSDGRRLIDAFHLPGDIFGIESGDEHSFTAEAVADAKVRMVKLSALRGMAERDSDLAADLRKCVTAKLRATQDHMVLLGRKTAEERVAVFLLGMATISRTGGPVELPMSRQDIADYLGLTIETVSRTLTQLRNRSAIELPTARRITLCDRAALQRLDA
ncbi:MAG TPA: helix-turn-helix domain-containing protein [Bauldia sp.]|nr:helix-turn-helix domain-containing protein [Bauldia sp.]